MIINGVAAMLESTNTEVKENAILFLGNLGSTDNGLGVILNSNVLDLFLDVFNGSAGNSRLLSLQALSLILNVSNPKTESIFYRIYGNKLDSLVQYSKSAFDEFRVASYAILKSLTLHEWGCLLLSKREVAEFLVDRNSDSSKIGCEWKFSIIQSIVSGGYLNAFDQETQKAFERYLKAGVFFREVGTEVEYEAI